MATQQTDEPEQNVITPESEKIRQHRDDFFRQVFGPEWPQSDIDRLVMSKASPHDAEGLKDQGCPLDLIVQILT